MKTHQLKTWLEPFEAIMSRRKKCEVRKNDRDFREGDELDLLEYDPDEEDYTGRYAYAKVTHLVGGGEWVCRRTSS